MRTNQWEVALEGLGSVDPSNLLATGSQGARDLFGPHSWFDLTSPRPSHRNVFPSSA